MWQFHRISERLEQRKHQVVCHRCGLLYQKILDACPHCAGLTDDEVKQLVTQRARFRLGLGKVMMVGAIMIVVLLIIINTS